MTRYSLKHPTNDGSKGLLSFNNQIGVGIEYALTKRYSLIAMFNSYSTSKNYENATELYEVIQTIYLDDLLAELDVNSFTAEYRNYPTSLAPYGTYLGLILNYKIIDLIQPEAISNLPPNYRPFNQSPYSLVSAGISAGKQRIFFNILSVSGGINILIPLEINKMGWFRESDEEGKYQESFDIYKRILNHDLINLRLSIGLLL